jgi:hypothetical protein
MQLVVGLKRFGNRKKTKSPELKTQSLFLKNSP